MKHGVTSNYAALVEEDRRSAEFLILPDGRILVHNLTPAVAALLAELVPDDADMRRRAAALLPASPPPPPSTIPSTQP